MKNVEINHKIKCELYNDSMQNWKKYPIKKAQLVIADVPYNVGNNFYGSCHKLCERRDVQTIKTMQKYYSVRHSRAESIRLWS